MTDKTVSRPRGRPAKDRIDGRRALLQAATEAFARHGFDGADLRTIAKKAGVSPNLVRVHFGSKAELWVACADGLATAMTPGFEAIAALAADMQRPLADRLRDGILVIALFYEMHPDIRDFVSHGVSESADRAALVTERLLRPAYEAGRALIVAGMEAGIIKASHPALFFALLNNAVSQPPEFPELLTRLAPEINRAEARARLTETIVATLLHLSPKAVDTATTTGPFEQTAPAKEKSTS